MKSSAFIIRFVKRAKGGQLRGGSNGGEINAEGIASIDCTRSARDGAGNTSRTIAEGDVGAIGARNP
jgi:hypothetical protein